MLKANDGSGNACYAGEWVSWAVTHTRRRDVKWTEKTNLVCRTRIVGLSLLRKLCVSQLAHGQITRARGQCVSLSGFPSCPECTLAKSKKVGWQKRASFFRNTSGRALRKERRASSFPSFPFCCFPGDFFFFSLTVPVALAKRPLSLSLLSRSLTLGDTKSWMSYFFPQWSLFHKLCISMHSRVRSSVENMLWTSLLFWNPARHFPFSFLSRDKEICCPDKYFEKRPHHCAL